MGGDKYPPTLTICSDLFFGGYKESCPSLNSVLGMPWRLPGGKGALSTGLLTDSIEGAMNWLCYIRAFPGEFVSLVSFKNFVSVSFSFSKNASRSLSPDSS